MPRVVVQREITVWDVSDLEDFLFEAFGHIYKLDKDRPSDELVAYDPTEVYPTIEYDEMDGIAKVYDKGVETRSILLDSDSDDTGEELSNAILDLKSKSIVKNGFIIEYIKREHPYLNTQSMHTLVTGNSVENTYIRIDVYSECVVMVSLLRKIGKTTVCVLSSSLGCDITRMDIDDIKASISNTIIQYHLLWKLHNRDNIDPDEFFVDYDEIQRNENNPEEE